MFNKRVSTLAIAALIGTTLTGCATQQGNEQLVGAGVGCAAGAVVGGLIGGRSGAAIGCAAGGALGFGAVKISQYNAEQARSQQADANRYSKVDPDFYGLNRSATETAIKVRSAQTVPETIRPGQLVTATTDYSIVTPQNISTVTVDESWVLKKDGEEIASLSAPPQTRDSGGWTTKSEFNVPDDAAPGVYVVEHKVQTGTSYSRAVSAFTIN